MKKEGNKMFKEFNLDNLENSKDLLEVFLDENRKKVSDLLKLENKTLNDVEFALKKQLQDRARQMQSGEKSSDGEENESDDDW